MRNLVAIGYLGLSLLADGFISDGFGQELSRATLNVDQIYQSAKAQREAIKNIRARYEVSFRQLMELPSLKEQRVTLALAPYRVLFAFDGERRKFYREPVLAKVNERHHVVDGAPDPRSHTAVFDGSRSVVFAEGGIATIKNGKDKSSEDGEYYCTEVLGIPLRDGNRVSYDNGWYYPYCLRTDPMKRANYRVLPKLEQVDGAWCHVVVADGFDKLWIDPELDCAYRKRERYFSPDQPVLITRVFHSNFVERAPGVWVPLSWRRETFAPPSNPQSYWNKVYVEVSLKASEVFVNEVTDDDFKVRLPAGSYVVDMATSTTYQVPGNEVDVLKDLVRSGEKYRFNDGNSQFSWPSILIVIGSVIFAAIIVFSIWMRKRAVT